MLKAVQKLDIEVLETHPWQKNIPDMNGEAWEEFLEDIQENGVQHPITISNRTAKHVVVDGHQRLRAAKEVGLREIDAIAKPFQDELAEIYFIVSSNKRRQLSKPQRIAIALSLKEAVAKQAEARQKTGKKSDDLRQNFAQGSSEASKDSESKSADERKTSATLAEMANTNREDVRKGSKIINEAPDPVKESWEREELSTHAAYKLTIAAKADSELYEALNNGEITSLKAIEALKKGTKDATEDPKEEKESEEEKETKPEEPKESTQETKKEIQEPEEVINTPEEPTGEIQNIEQELNEFLEVILSKGSTSQIEQLIEFLQQAVSEKEGSKVITVKPATKPIRLNEAVELLLTYSTEQLEEELGSEQLEQLQAVCTPEPEYEEGFI